MKHSPILSLSWRGRSACCPTDQPPLKRNASSRGFWEHPEASRPATARRGPSHLERKLAFSLKSGILNLGTADTWGEKLLWGLGAVLCIMGCLATSPASTHQMPGALPSCNNQKCLQTWPIASLGVIACQPESQRACSSKSGVESSAFP